MSHRVASAYRYTVWKMETRGYLRNTLSMHVYGTHMGTTAIPRGYVV